MFLGMLSCSDYRQLKSGRWVGSSAHGVFVTAPFPMGETPKSFRLTVCEPALKEERDEYWNILDGEFAELEESNYRNLLKVYGIQP